MTDESLTGEHEPAATAGASTAVAHFSKTAADLAALRARHASLVFDMTDAKQAKEAKEARAELRTLRTGLDKLRLKLNRDDQDRIDGRNTEAKSIAAEIVALEDPIAAQIDKAAKAEADAKAERDRIELARVKGIRDRIEWMRALPGEHIGKPAAEIESTFAGVCDLPITKAVYAEMLDEAKDVHALTISKLTSLLQQSRETEAARERDRAREREDEERRQRIAREDAARAERVAREDRERAEQFAAENRARTNAVIAAAWDDAHADNARFDEAAYARAWDDAHAEAAARLERAWDDAIAEDASRTDAIQWARISAMAVRYDVPFKTSAEIVQAIADLDAEQIEPDVYGAHVDQAEHRRRVIRDKLQNGWLPHIQDTEARAALERAADPWTAIHGALHCLDHNYPAGAAEILRKTLVARAELEGGTDAN